MKDLAVGDDAYTLAPIPVKPANIGFPAALRPVADGCDNPTLAHAAADRRSQSLKLEALGQMTCEVVHDFNNLLAVILGNIDLLVECLTNDKQREIASATVGAAKRATGLVEQLLAFAREQPLEPRLVNLDDLINSFHKVLKCAVSAGVEIRHHRTEGLWQIELDANRLEVALLNLAINARDAMPDGGSLTIQTSNFETDQPVPDCEKQLAPGQYVRLSLTDTGHGMSPETMTRIFEPFFSTKKAGLGTGLGLSIVSGIVAQSGGEIRMASVPGKGTTCSLYFPRSIAITPV
jgi:signal transduction histidine kinase